jgi:peptidoglycan hydrolase CwlO-like protein
MLVEFISGNQEKLKKNVEEELPELKKLNLQIEFLNDRIEKLESSVEKLRNGGHQ